MLTNPKILVATDLSFESDLALLAGESLRTQVGGELHVVHVLTYPEAWGKSSRTMNVFSKDFKEIIFEENLNELKVQIDRTKCNGTFEVVQGNTEREILKLIEHRGSDLVIMSLGDSRTSLVHKLITSAPVPVLVLKQKFETARIAGLVDTVDPAPTVFEASEDLAVACNADLTYISVCQDIGAQFGKILAVPPIEHYTYSQQERSAILDAMDLYIRSHSGNRVRSNVVTEITSEPKISESLVRLLRDRSIQLAVMAAHHRSKIGQQVLGSVTRRLLETYGGNVLVVPPPGDGP